jgi:hypothetical protein
VFPKTIHCLYHHHQQKIPTTDLVPHPNPFSEAESRAPGCASDVTTRASIYPTIAARVTAFSRVENRYAPILDVITSIRVSKSEHEVVVSVQPDLSRKSITLTVAANDGVPQETPEPDLGQFMIHLEYLRGQKDSRSTSAGKTKKGKGDNGNGGEEGSRCRAEKCWFGRRGGLRHKYMAFLAVSFPK